MTKKDYELIAKPFSLLVKISRELENSNDSFEYKLAVMDKTLNQAIYFLIKDLEADNPRFNREMFMQTVDKK